MNNYLEEALNINAELIACRRFLHANPELGMNLPITTKYVVDKLEEYGLEPHIVAGSGVSACIGKPGGSTILLRADMDALPIVENADVDYKSTIDGHMHACGHDMHTTMLLGAAKILKANEDKLDGQVKFMFQPAEETLQGARAMIDAGILQNPKVDFALGMHVITGTNILPTGTLALVDGTLMAGCSSFELVIKGKGGHGAMPETTKDPIACAVQIYNQLNMIKMREVSAREPLVLTVGQFSFGDTYNVIPDKGIIKGTIRFFNNEVGDYTKNRVKEIAESTGKLFNCEVEYIDVLSTPACCNDKAHVEQVSKILKETLGSSKVFNGGKAEMGSEDFAYVSQQVPSVFMPIGAGLIKDGYTSSLHNPSVNFDENVLHQGVAVFVSVAIEWLKDNK